MFAWMLENHEAARNLGLVAAATLGILLGVWRSFIAEDQRSIAEKNHLAETYTKAIDQLGKPEDEIRLGGLYALEKIAQSNRHYHGQIMEVLCAFVRLHAPLENLKDKVIQAVSTVKNPLENQKPHNLTIQTALTIIGRRNVKFNKKPESGFERNVVEIDLSFTNLSGVNLSGANLSEVNLSSANLERAVLERTSLKWTNLEGANLEGTNLEAANLRKANLEKANLKEAYLAMANLFEANLFEANLLRAMLSSTYLNDATITLEQIQSARVFQSTYLPIGIDQKHLTFEQEVIFP